MNIRFDLAGEHLQLQHQQGAREEKKQVAQLLQRYRAAGWVSMAKSARLELEDNIYRHRSIVNHCDVFCQQSNRIR